MSIGWIFRGLTSLTGLISIGYLAVSLAFVRLWADGRSSPAEALLHQILRKLEPMGREGRDPVLLTFVFSFRDCSDALRLARHWSALHQSGRLQVRGLMLHSPADSEQITGFLRREGIEFPVIAVRDKRLAASLVGLGYDTTPISILSDARRRPRFIAPSSQDSLEQLAFVELVNAHIDRFTRPERHSR